MFVLKGLVGLHRTVQLQLPQRYWLGLDLDYYDIEWFPLETNRDHSVVFEIASKYCISDSFVDHGGYSVPYKGFLPTVVDITEVPDIVQVAGIKTIPLEKKCKKAKSLSGEALHIALKRREVKSKGEKESYKHPNAEFQRIARRDKKAFLRDQCKEIEENNRI